MDMPGHEHSHGGIPHSSDHGHAHSHGGHGHGKHEHDEHGDSISGSIAEDAIRYQKARRQLLCASFFCFIFMLVEAAGGFYIGSLAIMSDAAHLLADCAGF